MVGWIFKFHMLLLAGSSQARLFKYNVNAYSWSSSSEDSAEQVWLYPLPTNGNSSLEMSNVDSEVWAVLVAGSFGYYNYRHQADVCHAYHLLRNHGVHADHIITMMYDDIAHNKNNPYPGQIFNSPAKVDVYAGVRIDYRRGAVTPENFIAVLTGNRGETRGGNGRVLQSRGDKVFIYFSDHGATGMLMFPKGILTVKQLSSTIQKMHRRQMFTEMTLYIEACESGSMFETVLPSNIKVYAVTAANGHESSYACYCDAIDGLPCLGDLFSVSWLYNSEEENLNSESIEVQYAKVKQLTNTSHVCRFGDHSIWHEHVGEFQGNASSVNQGLQLQSLRPAPNPYHYSMWSSRDIPILERLRRRGAEKDDNEKRRLTTEINILQKKRLYLERQVKTLVERVVHDVNNRNRILENYPKKLHRNIDCHDNIVHTFHDSCFDFNMNPYALKYVYVLANLCELGIDESHLLRHLVDHCSPLNSTDMLAIV